MKRSGQESKEEVGLAEISNTRLRRMGWFRNCFAEELRSIGNEKSAGQDGERRREKIAVSQVESLGTSGIIRQVMIADKPYTPLDAL